MAISDKVPSALRDAGCGRLAPSTVLTLCCFSAASLNAVLSCGADRAAQTPRRYGFEVGSAVSVGVLTAAAGETAFFRALIPALTGRPPRLSAAWSMAMPICKRLSTHFPDHQ